MTNRKGLGKGKGSGWKNIKCDDSTRHSLASKGIKSAQNIPRINKIPKKQPKKYDTVDNIIAYENDELNDLMEARLFADLIKSGKAWTLQGHYGRRAMSYIKAGYIDRQGNIDYDKFNLLWGTSFSEHSPDDTEVSDVDSFSEDRDGDMGDIKCQCGKTFRGMIGKEDTCPSCLKKLIHPKDSDGDGVPDDEDCQPDNPDKQDEKIQTKYNTVLKRQFIKPTRMNFPLSMKSDVDEMLEDMKAGWTSPFEFTRQDVTYKWRGDVFYSDINNRVNSNYKRSKYKDAINDYIYDELMKDGFYIHS